MFVICGDGEYTVYTALKLANKAYGNALQFVWSDSPDVFATLEDKRKIKLFKKFKETKPLKTNFDIEGIFGGHLLGVKSDSDIVFYDWDELRLIRRIEVVPEKSILVR
eukprot:UN34130